MYGILNKDIYQVEERIPLDYGQVFTLDETQRIFSLKYKKGTRLYRKREDEDHYAWYTKDGDDGWSEFFSLQDYFNGKRYHSVISNLILKGK